MNLTLEKQKIKQEIDKINDENIILVIKRFLGLAAKNKIEHLTVEQLVQRALESEKAIADKSFTALEELEKEMRNW